MIKVNDISKRYGKLLANDHITMEVGEGEISILLGPNGAGKSTLIKSICGLLRFDGEITINGYENHSLEAKRLLGYVPQMAALYPMLTVYEHFEFIARAYKLENWKHRAEDFLKRFELDDKRDKLGKELSGGMAQKVSICCALLHQPKAIVFDEPMTGLDPHGIKELKSLFVELKAQGCSMIISTHMIESIEDNWDVTQIMMQGQIKKICYRNDLKNGENLEELFFEITEKGNVHE